MHLCWLTVKQQFSPALAIASSVGNNLKKTDMRLPELLIFNFYTKYFLKKIESFSFPNRRLKSMLTDFGFLLAIFFPLFLIMLVPFIIFDNSEPTNKIDLSYILSSIPFALMAFTLLNKDFFNGSIVANRI